MLATNRPCFHSALEALCCCCLSWFLSLLMNLGKGRVSQRQSRVLGALSTPYTGDLRAIYLGLENIQEWRFHNFSRHALCEPFNYFYIKILHKVLKSESCFFFKKQYFYCSLLGTVVIMLITKQSSVLQAL